MFLISLSYRQDLDVVDRYVAEHREYLQRYYASGHFLLSGRKEPRTGGVILAQASSRAEIDAIVQCDPFYREKIAEYHITEFLPSMANEHLQSLLLVE